MKNKHTVLSNVAYGPHERHRSDVFIPLHPKSASGLILIIHGGGWSDGDKSIHHPDAEYYSDNGYVCAAVNYRFVTETLTVYDELDDITAALKTIKEKCAENGFSLDKLILSGTSAGAHLALLYAYTRKDSSPVLPVAACVYCPPVDCFKTDFLSGNFEDWKYDILSKCSGTKVTRENFLDTDTQKALKMISPSEYVTPDCVPTAVYHGAHDEIIPLSHVKEFTEQLSLANVKNKLLIYPNSGHALDKDPDCIDTAKLTAKEYAERYL